MNASQTNLLSAGSSKFVSAKELSALGNVASRARTNFLTPTSLLLYIMFNSRGVPTRTAGQALTPRRESVSDDPEADSFWKKCLAAHPTSNVLPPFAIVKANSNI